jgi:hypothetical protein
MSPNFREPEGFFKSRERSWESNPSPFTLHPNPNRPQRRLGTDPGTLVKRKGCTAVGEVGWEAWDGNEITDSAEGPVRKPDVGFASTRGEGALGFAPTDVTAFFGCATGVPRDVPALDSLGGVACAACTVATSTAEGFASNAASADAADCVTIPVDNHSYGQEVDPQGRL